MTSFSFWVRKTTEYELWSLVVLLAISIIANLASWYSSKKKIKALQEAVDKLDGNFSRFNNLIALYIKTEKKLRKDDQSLKWLELWVNATSAQTKSV